MLPEEKQRLFLVLCTLALNVVWMTVCALVPFSDWRTAAGLLVVDVSAFAIFALRKRDTLLGRLLFFGLCLGLVELAADAYLADVTKTLDFSIDGGSPKLWSSPIYMPLAWQVVAVQIGVISLWLHGRFGSRGIAYAALFGAACMPAYEELARLNHWWRYVNCRMLHFTPLHEVVAYLFVMLAIAASATRLRQNRHPMAVAAGLGVASGLVVLFAFIVTFRLIG